MGQGKQKPKFYIRTSWNHKEWLAICWASNNVVVCECPNRQIAMFILDYLNGMTYKQLGRNKAK